jgi:uncharacterized protein (DUF362 family)
MQRLKRHFGSGTTKIPPLSADRGTVEQAMTRRDWLPLAAVAAATGFAGFYGGRRAAPLRGRQSPVYIHGSARYHDDLQEILRTGWERTGLEVAGKRVLVAPQQLAQPEANPHPSVVEAACGVLRAMGASHVQLGLGGDSGAQVRLAGFLGGELPVPEAVAKAELIVSVSKLKTDVRFRLGGAIPSLFELAPVWRGRRDASAAVEFVRLLRPSCALVDGIVGLEGDAPERGAPKSAGVLVLGPDLAAVDATCARIIGLDPWEVPYLEEAADRIGVIDQARISQLGAPLEIVRTRFEPAELRLS